jgi:signal transduction histidine kinase
LRDRQYLAYALFFGAIIVQFLSGTGMGRIWFWGESTEINTRLLFISTAFLVMSFCLIGQSLRFEHRYRASVNLVLRFLSIAMLPVAFYFLLLPFDLYTPGTWLSILILSLLVLLVVSVMAAISTIQGSRSALYLFLFCLVLLLASLSYLAYSSGIVERGAFAVSMVEILASIAALLLLASLAEFVRARNEEFDRARLETKAKGDFLCNVSREFLTPVHLVLANSKRLLAAKSNKLDDATKAHLTTVIQQSDYLHNLINDLLEMAELESDTFEPEFELLEISHFLTEVKDMILPTAMEKGLEITTNFAAANLLVQTDKVRLQHSLLNILTNAIKFTERGTILIGYKAVYFRRRLGIEIFIQDTGRGMSKEFQQRLFQEFSREDEPSEKESRGTGLGLVIVKRIIEKLGGEISFVSAAREGSEFFIRLPLRINTDEIGSYNSFTTSRR